MLTTTFAYFTSYTDWLIVGAIILVLFGGSKIPQLARGLGEGIREFKNSVNGDAKDDEEEKKTEDEKKPEGDKISTGDKTGSES
ncbi:twin-arginine translocase TatA/TatE family subunit [Armatimonas sp.]|uniref:twin-arginine translocase TatA/TatE family subunit n=1 Tax=Armatimonas sp. TaxID=1872638 RepID=UPI00286B822A|nr:twin-arginine translocase TatA/TatE family subunit [Armatimonas sp.]